MIQSLVFRSLDQKEIDQSINSYPRPTEKSAAVQTETECCENPWEGTSDWWGRAEKASMRSWMNHIWKDLGETELEGEGKGIPAGDNPL